MVKRAPRRPRVPRRKNVGKVSKAVKVEVAKQLAKSLENKMCMINGRGANNGTPIGTTYLEQAYQQLNDDTMFRGLIPRISDGTDAYQRMGNSITPKVLKIKGLLYFPYAVPESYDLTVRLMVVTHKSQKNQDELTSGAQNYFSTLMWNPITAQPVAYLGCEPYYNQLPVNRRQWNVLSDKQIHMRKSLGDAASANPSLGETFMSSTRSVPFEIVLTQKHLPAKLLYQAPGGDIPTNFAPVLAIGWTDNTGFISVGTTNTPIVAIQWTSSLIFEDA